MQHCRSIHRILTRSISNQLKGFTHVVPISRHYDMIASIYKSRGFNDQESKDAAFVATQASRHGVRTHNGLKGLHIDDHLGSKGGGCVPNVEIEELESRFPAVKKWNSNRKLGQSVALAAVDECVNMATKYGSGTVVVDSAFHYLYGGLYAMLGAQKGFIFYTNCTAGLAEVVPYQGKIPTLGTNPHSYGFPTQDILGYPIVMDWATSVIASGRVAQLRREGLPLPPKSAVDIDGKYTTDPKNVAALVPFGDHKGYGLSLLNELYGAYVGGGCPTLRNRWEVQSPETKRTCVFYFHAIHPEAIGCDFGERTQSENVQSVLQDIYQEGNHNCVVPGQFEHEAALLCEIHGGLLFSSAEVEEFRILAREVGFDFEDDFEIVEI